MQITKIIDSNVMDWGNVTEVHTLPSAKQIFLLDEHAPYITKTISQLGMASYRKPLLTGIAKRDGDMFILFHGH